MSQRLARLLVGFGVLLLGTPAVTQANSVLFTNFGASFSYDVSAGNVVGSDFAGSFYSQGDTFVASSTGLLSTIEIALSEVFGGSQADPITVSLTANAGGLPGGILESFSIAPGSLGLLGNNNAPIVLSSVLNPLLSFGTQYWITASLPGGPLGAGPAILSGVAWNWNSTGDPSAEAIDAHDGFGWFSSGLTPGAFEVDSLATVPEPATMFLGGLGLIAFGYAARRRLFARQH